MLIFAFDKVKSKNGIKNLKTRTDNKKFKNSNKNCNVKKILEYPV